MHPSEFELTFANADEKRFHSALKQASQAYLHAKQDHVYAGKADLIAIVTLFAIALLSYLPTLFTSSTLVYVSSYFVFVLLIMLLNVIINMTLATIPCLKHAGKIAYLGAS